MIINYNVTNLEALAARYNTCMELLDDVRQGLADAQATVNNTYQGRVAPVVDDTFAKLAQHYALLYDCCHASRDYVEDAKQRMAEAEAALVAAMEGA